MENRSQIHCVDHEHPIISEFKPYDFEKRSRSIWSNAEELRRIGVRCQFNMDKPVDKRMLNIVIGNIVSPCRSMNLHTVLL